jgi:hypothetical protein
LEVVLRICAAVVTGARLPLGFGGASVHSVLFGCLGIGVQYGADSIRVAIGDH